MTEQTPTEAPSTVGSSIGQRLRQARERQQLELAEIARTLRLSPESVQALEMDNYHPFAAPAYVRGYLRNYARLIGVSEQAILSEFDSAGHSESNTPKVRSFDKLSRQQNNHLGSWIALAGLLLLATAGWFAITQDWFTPGADIEATNSSSQVLNLDEF